MRLALDAVCPGKGLVGHIRRVAHNLALTLPHTGLLMELGVVHVKAAQCPWSLQQPYHGYSVTVPFDVSTFPLMAAGSHVCQAKILTSVDPP